MLTRAIQQSFASLVTPLETIAVQDPGVQQVIIQGLNAALSVTPFAEGHRGQYAHLTGQDGSIAPAFLAWNLRKAHVALGYTPNDRVILEQVAFDITHTDIPPVVGMVTSSYSYLLVNSGNPRVKDGRSGLTLPGSVVHNASFPFARVHQQIIQEDRFDLDAILMQAGVSSAAEFSELWTKFDKSIDELELSVRTRNAIQNANIVYIGELVQKTEVELLKTKNFGRRSLNEIKEVLEDMFGLSLGIDVGEWRAPNVRPAGSSIQGH